jgi:transcriptional regulator with XRE-family HTH domain
MGTRNKVNGAEDALAFLDREFGPLTLGRALRAIRETQEVSLTQFARRIGVSVQHLSDVEKDRRGVSAERAAKWARRLGHPPTVFVQLALQQQINAAGLRLKVTVQAA